MPVISPRGYVAGNFLLRLDGADAGFVKSIDGGAISADVISEPAGNSYFVRKHIGAPKYEDFTIQVGWWMNNAVYDWIRASWTMNQSRKNGSIVSYDFNMEARSEREFFNALITEVTIPAMDAGSKEQCYLTVKFTPELIRTKKAAGKATLPPVKAAQEMWLPSNFRLEIGGLDCTKVSGIDVFTVRQKALLDNIGNTRDYQREPGRLEFPNLSITMAETAATTWLDWFEDFVVKGDNGETREKTGSLVFLSPNLQTELGRINFFNLGIFKIAPAKADAADERIQRLTAQLYCERMELQIGKLS